MGFNTAWRAQAFEVDLCTCPMCPNRRTPSTKVRGKAGVACLPLPTLVEGVRLLLDTAWHHRGPDVQLAAGAEF